MAPKLQLKDKVEDGEMDLSLSDLQDVPVKEIVSFKKVHTLDLSNNHLIFLPATFPSLINIIKLDLSKNKLKELPANFGDLTKLKHLDLYKNELQHLPLTFSKLKNLRWLDLKDNPLVPVVKKTAGPCIDSKQCQKCAKDIVQFYGKLQEKIDQEKQIREAQRQKSKIVHLNSLHKAKAQSKKAKKNQKKKGEENLIPSLESDSLIDLEADETTPKEKEKYNYSYSISSILLYIAAFSFLSMITLSITSAFNFQLSQSIISNIDSIWKDNLKTLPSFLIILIKQLEIVVVKCHTLIGNCILHAIETLGKIMTEENITKVFSMLYAGHNALM